MKYLVSALTLLVLLLVPAAMADDDNITPIEPESPGPVMTDDWADCVVECFQDRAQCMEWCGMDFECKAACMQEFDQCRKDCQPLG